MKILRLSRDFPLLPIPNEIALVLDDALPPIHLVTSALALAFDGERILMTNLNARGWDIPGGHLEVGETPEAALQREVLEETGATLSNVRLLGYQRITLHAPCPPNYRYPFPDSYQTLFFATVAELLPFSPTEETRKRALFTPDEALALRWVQENREMYDAAVAFLHKEG
jgi:8-oxo-dGTP pyrophosphatase MutT (NUDIX family)